jgi:hypothetical protein
MGTFMFYPKGVWRNPKWRVLHSIEQPIEDRKQDSSLYPLLLYSPPKIPIYSNCKRSPLDE